MTNKIVINGVTIVGGNNITVRNNKVFVDGKDVTPDAKEIHIAVTGDIERVNADACSEITVTGNTGSVTTQSGDVTICGNISGSVQTMSGDVDCDGAITGSVSTMSGDIRSHR